MVGGELLSRYETRRWVATPLYGSFRGLSREGNSSPMLCVVSPRRLRFIGGGESEPLRFNFHNRFNMTRKELAELLGISGAMVSKLAKRGMPTDSLERAQRWRKRHLEPGRVKGMRLDTRQPDQPAKPSPAPGARSTISANRPDADPVPVASAATVERLARITGAALAGGSDQDQAAGMLAHLREQLRALPDAARPCMPLRVWLALVDYALAEDAPMRRSHDVDAILSPEEFAQRVKQDGGAPWAWWLDDARDWRGYSVTGFPDCLEED